MAMDPSKMALLNHDPERPMMHNLPNITSPGRLMIGPKVATNEGLIGPMQRSVQEQYRMDQLDVTDPYQDPKQPQNLKNSASKDSLMSNMLSSVTKFLSGGGTKQNDRGKTTVRQEVASFKASEPPS